MGQRVITKNSLFYGDNLDILRQYIANETIDLIYLDPPFNSNRNYNVLYKDESGVDSASQIVAFEDTWHWSHDTEAQYRDMSAVGDRLGRLLDTFVDVIGRNQMAAYLVMMAARLVELHRVLKPTGSLYLHCDPTASHYLKMILDMIFGAGNYRNEITWKRRHGFSSAVHESNRFGNCTDIIFFYAKSNETQFTPQYNRNSKEYQEYVDKYFKLVDAHGRKYQATSLTNPAYRPNLIYEYKGYKPPENGWMISKEKMEQWDKEGRIHFPQSKDGRLRRKSFVDELKGMPIQNLWDDIEQLGAHDAERLGYPTQKPLSLLERIIQASSNPGDVVLDPFCGCGTAVHAAQKLGRIWAGIDITPLATTLIKSRLYDAFGIEAKKDYDLFGEPTTLADAEHLAKQDRYQFQWWALGLIPARPQGGQGDSKEGKKGADKGIDGVMTFQDTTNGVHKRIMVQVKSGKVKSGDIRDLNGTVDREKNAVMGVFITLQKPSSDMEIEAMSYDPYQSGFNRHYPKVQIFTIEQLLNGAKVQVPGSDTTLKQAQRERDSAGEQRSLL